MAFLNLSSGLILNRSLLFHELCVGELIMSKQFHFGSPGSLPVILSSAKMPNPKLFEGQCHRRVIMSVRE